MFLTGVIPKPMNQDPVLPKRHRALFNTLARAAERDIERRPCGAHSPRSL
jgi:hypothetical protein